MPQLNRLAAMIDTKRLCRVWKDREAGGSEMQQHDSSQDRIQQLEEELAALRAEMAELRTYAACIQRGGRGGHVRSAHASGRRTLLKWAGAAAATAAVTMLATEQSAKAADGDPILAGQTTTALSETILIAGTGATANPLLTLTNSTGIGLSVTSSPRAYGIQAFAGVNAGDSGTAVFGQGGTGVVGVSNSGAGVSGGSVGTSGVGVVGSGEQGYGVIGTSHSGIDIGAVGTGRIWQSPQNVAGAPTSGTYKAGEQIRDSNGDIYICVAGNGLNLGVWKRVTAIPAGALGGALVFLHAPFRIFDTRPGVAGCPDDPGTPMMSTGGHTIQVTNNPSTADATLVVPTGATGIVGDLICINSSGNGVSAPGDGFLTLQPHSATATGNSYLHYYGDDVVQIYHNSFTIGLSADGKLDVGNYGSTTNVGLDILGYII